MLQFHTLGTIDLRSDDGERIESPLLHSKQLALLAYLCVARPAQLHRRDEIVALLWPELDDAHARGALRHELYALRRALGQGVLRGSGGEAVGVDAGRIWCDAEAFETAVETDHLAGALDLWKGEFLPGLHVDGGEFERWLDEARDHLGREAVAAARRLSLQAEEEGDVAGAIRWARRLTELAPYEEAGWQRLLSLLDRSGDRASALRAYESLVAKLRDELEVEPSPETRALADTIRQREKPDVRALSAPAVARRTSDREAAAETTRVEIMPGEAAQLPAAAPASAPDPRRSRAGRRRGRLAGVVVTGAVTLALSLAPVDQPDAASAPAPWVVIELRPVANRTGAAEFDAVAQRLTDRLAAGVAELPFVSLAMGTPGLQAAAVVTGTLYRRGALAEVQLRIAESGRVGRLVGVTDPALLRADAGDAPLDTLVARTLAAVSARFDPRAAIPQVAGHPVRTPGWEAYLEYMEGAELYGAFRFAEAAQHLGRAYALDPGFAKAGIFQAIALAYGGEYVRADSVASTAIADGTAITDYERYLGMWVLADLHSRRADAYRAVIELSRITSHPVIHLIAGLEASKMNRPRESLRLGEGWLVGAGWWRNWTAYYEMISGSYHELGEHGRELAVALAGRVRFPGALDAVRAEARARAALGDVDRVHEVIREAFALPPWPALFVPLAQITPAVVAWSAAQELETHGKPAAADVARAAGLAWLSQRNGKTRADSLLQVRLLLESGDVPRAGAALSSLAPFNDLESLGLAGLVAAAAGDRAAAEAVLGQLEGLENPYLGGRHLLLAAGVRAALGERDAALETLQRAFAAGLPYTIELHALPMLRPLAREPGFQTLLAPRG